jgi:hypothetical protein
MNPRKFFVALFALVVIVILVYVAWGAKQTENPEIPQVSNISSFNDCVKAGFPVMESYPAQCRTLDGKSFTQDIGNELEKKDLIIIDSPRPNQEISSPLVIRGSARGNWYFEASFPAKLLDANNKILAVIPVQAQGEWMTTDFVPFKVTINFEVPTTDTGTLVLEKSNASGLPEHDDQLRIPVKFSKGLAQIPDPNKELFQESDAYGFFGTLNLTGYIDIQKRICNPGDMCGETVDYASLIFSDTNNEAIKKFTGQYNGNSYIAGDRVGLGCYQKDSNRIYYINFADAKDSARGSEALEGQIVGDDLKKLLASTKTKPVTVKLTRPIYTSGQGAPDCYSHFRNFDVL